MVGKSHHPKARAKAKIQEKILEGQGTRWRGPVTWRMTTMALMRQKREVELAYKLKMIDQKFEINGKNREEKHELRMKTLEVERDLRREQGKTRALEGEVERVKRKAGELQSEHEALRQRVRGLEARRDELQDENETLGQRLARRDDENETLRRRVGDLQFDNDTLRAKLRRLEA